MSNAAKSRFLGMTSCGCTVASLVVFFTFMFIVLFTNTCAKIFGEETYPLKSDPTRFDPFAGIEEVRAKVSPKARLVSVEATFVRHDGTMDLNANYKPRVTYKFVVPLDKTPDDAPPVGAGRAPGDVPKQEVDVEVYRPGTVLNVSKVSGGSSTKYTYTMEGMDIDRKKASMGTVDPDIGSPKVSTADLWKMAVDDGATKDAVARIEYDKNGYKLSITDLKIRIELDADGKPRK